MKDMAPQALQGRAARGTPDNGRKSSLKISSGVSFFFELPFDFSFWF